MKDKVKGLNKFQCHQQIKALQKKEHADIDLSDLLDDISEEDNSKSDPDFVCSMPCQKMQQVQRSLLTEKRTRKHNRCKSHS